MRMHWWWTELFLHVVTEVLFSNVFRIPHFSLCTCMIIIWLHQQSFIHAKDAYIFFCPPNFFSNINFSSLKLPEDLNMRVSACSERFSVRNLWQHLPATTCVFTPTCWFLSVLRNLYYLGLGWYLGPCHSNRQSQLWYFRHYCLYQNIWGLQQVSYNNACEGRGGEQLDA